VDFRPIKRPAAEVGTSICDAFLLNINALVGLKCLPLRISLWSVRSDYVSLTVESG